VRVSGFRRWLLSLFVPGAVLVSIDRTALASALTVAPVTLTMPAGQMASSLTLSNPGHQPLAFQIRAFSWEQRGGSDHLAATDALQFSPPMGLLAAGASQVVRLVLRSPAQVSEASYRLLIDQIPPPASPGTVSMVLRMSIPVFAEPPSRVFPDLQWHVETNDKQAWLVAENRGGSHEVVRNLALRAPDGSRVPVEGGAFGYVLAGASRRWELALHSAALAASTVMELSAQTDHGSIDIDVPVAMSKP